MSGRTAWLVCRLVALWVVLAAGSAAGAPPKQVLLLHSFGREFAPFNTFSETFRTELGQQLEDTVEFHDVPLESARLEGEASEGPLVEYLNALFARQRPDLVVTVGGPAARFAQQHRARLFPSTPMLLAATDARLLQTAALTTDDTVVAVTNDIVRLMDSILQVLPETTNIAVVIGNSPLEKFWLGELRRQLQPFTNRVSFAWLNELSFPGMLRRAAVLPPRSAIYYAMLSVDAEGVPYVEERALRELHAVANAPIFGLFDSQMGRGIVGGPLLAVEELGRNAAKAAVRILRGEPAGSIKTPTQVPGRPVYDWRELRRWHISQARLPMGSVVRFRQPTAWEQYKWQIIGVLALCVLEAVLIVLLLLNRVRRRRADLALRESEQRMSLATAAADLGVWAWDMHDNRIWVSENWRRMFGVPPGTHIGFETVFARVHPEDREAMELSVKQAIKGQADYLAEYRIIRPDGTQRWVGTRGRLHSGGNAKHDRLLGVSVDITERKLAEAALKQSEERFRQVAETVGDFIWEVDANGLYRYTSPSVEKILGYKPEDLNGKVHFYDLFLPTIREELKAGALKKFAAKEMIRSFPNPNVSKQRRIVHLETSGVPILDEAGNLVGYRGADTDVTARREAEEALRQSEARYRHLYESMRDAFVATDMSGRLQEFNSVYQQMLGYTEAELRALTYTDITPERWRAAEAAVVRDQVLARGYSEVYEKEYRKKDGTVFPVELRTFLIQDDAGEPAGMWAIVRDITERKAAERALQQSEERLRLVLEANSEGVWDWNIPSGKAYFSPHYSAMLGYEPEEFAQDYAAWKALVHPDDFERVNAAHAAHIHHGAEFCVEFRMRKKSGDWRWIRSRGTVVERDAEGRAIRMVGTHLDITERRRAEATLHETQTTLNAIIESTNDLIWSVDPVAFGLMTFNRGLRDYFLEGRGIRVEPGMRPEDLFPPGEYVQRWRDFYQRALQEGPFTTEYVVYSQNRTLQLSFNVLKQDGTVFGVSVFGKDITERKRAELEVQEQRQQLAHVARVSVMGELAASVAHELNQPLGAILSNAEAAEMLLQQEPPALGDVRDILTDIRQDDERAGAVIYRMRALLRKRELEHEPLQINAVVEDVFRLVSADAALRKTGIAADLSPYLSPILGDRIHLQQVLLNLIMNALEAMSKQRPEKRRLTVRTSTASDGGVEVSVSDSGPGIEPDKLARLFEPFYTTKPNGMGMGLSIARTIVAAHDGRIWAENHPAGGAVFRFTVPSVSSEGPVRKEGVTDP